MERFEFLTEKVLKYRLRRGAEVGVKSGRTTLHLLSRAPWLHMTAVDAWAPVTADQVTDQGVVKNFAKAPQEKYEARLRRNGKRYTDQGRLGILKGDSVAVAATLPDESLDFVFIDGCHTYEACKADIRAWRPKVKLRGFLFGHDALWPGVLQAIQEEEPHVNITPHDQVWWAIRQRAPGAFHHIALPDLKVVFSVNGKCGSGAIKSLVRNYLRRDQPIHKSSTRGLDFWSTEQVVEECGDWLRIGIVRDPWKRIVSCYWDKVARTLRPRFRAQGVPEKATLEQFVEAVRDIPDSIADPHFRSQTYVLLHEGELITSHLYRLEEPNGWSRIQRALEPHTNRPWPSSLPKVHRTQDKWQGKSIGQRGKGGAWSAMAKATVRERFRTDYRELGYG